MKPTTLISMKEYCKYVRPRDAHELIIEAVRKEDEWNHVYQPITIPKMNYPKYDIKGSGGVYGLLKSILP